MKAVIINDDGTIMGEFTFCEVVKESVLQGDIQQAEFGGWDGEFFTHGFIRKKI